MVSQRTPRCSSLLLIALCSLLTKADRLAIYHDIGRVVVKDGRDVLAGEGVGGV